MTRILLSLGANLGDRFDTIEGAVATMIEQKIIHSPLLSSFYESEPVGYEEQPSFINCALVGSTTLQPKELFNHIKLIEKYFGRKERPRWHERELDIDIILFGDMVIQDNDLIIPHPRMCERSFVLLPASEIASDMIHPYLNKTVTDLYEECNDNHGIYAVNRAKK